MQKFRKIGEFYTENGDDDQKIKEALASVGYDVCWLEDYCSGSHYVIMEAIKCE